MPYANRIEAVRANYDRLNERAKTLVTKLETLVALEERIEYFISLGQDNIAAAQSVINLIQALVSLDDLAYEDKKASIRQKRL